MAKKQGQERRKGHKKDRKSAAEAAMSPAAFKRWRKSLKLSQKEAAQALGLKRRAVQYYEKGERDGDSVDIPKTVRLACFALAQGCADYAGPVEAPKGKDASDSAPRPVEDEPEAA